MSHDVRRFVKAQETGTWRSQHRLGGRVLISCTRHALQSVQDARHADDSNGIMTGTRSRRRWNNGDTSMRISTLNNGQHLECPHPLISRRWTFAGRGYPRLPLFEGWKSLLRRTCDNRRAFDTLKDAGSSRFSCCARICKERM